MVSPELIRRYPIFAGLSLEQITTLAHVAEEIAVKAEYYFFRDGEELDHFYIVLEGRVGILVDLPVQGMRQPVSRQITGSLETREVVVSTIEPGEMFAWSALVPPHTATSKAKALTSSRVVSFDCRELRKIFEEEDCRFAYLMMQKAAQRIRQRLRDMRIESLSLEELPIP
jgi:CRP-like cAMP-binding protein